MNKKTLFQFVLILASSLLLVSCGDDQIEPQSFKYSQNFTMDNFGNPHTIIESPSAHSGKKICHLDSGAIYGFSYSYNIPDSLVGHSLTCYVDAWARTGKLDNKCSIVCSVTNGKDSILVWKAIDALPLIKNADEWVNLSGSFPLSEQEILFGGKITIMCMNNSALSYFDVDDLKITYSETDQQPDAEK